MAPIEKFSVDIKVSKWLTESIFIIQRRSQLILEPAEVILEHFKNVFLARILLNFIILCFWAPLTSAQIVSAAKSSWTMFAH